MSCRPSWLCFYNWLKAFGATALLINLIASAVNFWHYVTPEVTTIYTVAGSFAQVIRIMLIFIVILGVFEAQIAYKIFPFLKSFFGIGLTCMYLGFENLGAAGVVDALAVSAGVSKFLPVSCYILLAVGMFFLFIGCVGGRSRIAKSRHKLEVEAEADSMKQKELSKSRMSDLQVEPNMA